LVFGCVCEASSLTPAPLHLCASVAAGVRASAVSSVGSVCVEQTNRKTSHDDRRYHVKGCHDV
jgi:hypothetical protein